MDLEELRLPLSVTDKGFKAGLTAAVAGVGALVGAMGMAIKATFDWADQLDQIGDIMDVTNDTAAALNFTLRKSGVDTNTFTKGMVILNKGLVDANGRLDTTGKALKKWGINVLDVNGKLKNNTDLIGSISDKYATFATQQEKVNFLTEVFGRSGAELIDFFDTMAQGGGLDAVTEKVKALGLAIDPSRYEQFNRNLEELKMVGLGFAVAFTEKVMPLVEKFVKWLGDMAQSEGFKNFVKKFEGFAGAISDAIGRGDWASVKALLVEALHQLDSAIADWLNTLDWTGAGATFGTWLQNVLTSGAGQVDIPSAFTALDQGVTNFIMSALGADKFGTWENYWQAWQDMIMSDVTTFWTNWNAAAEVHRSDLSNSIQGQLSATSVAIHAWAGGTIATVQAWGGNLLNIMTNTMNDLYVNTSNRLRDIAKEFFNRAVAWGQQMIAGLEGSKGRLLAYIGGLVDDINAELKKIMTDFVIKVKTVFGGGSSSGGGSTGNHATGTTTTGHESSGALGGGYAEGGIASGSSAGHWELLHGTEAVIPLQNGAVPVALSGGMQAVAITNFNDFDYSRLASEVVKAQNNV